jgi:hypothetical protein
VELACILNLERGGSEEFGSTVRVVAGFDPAIDGAKVQHGRSRAKADWNVLYTYALGFTDGSSPPYCLHLRLHPQSSAGTRQDSIQLPRNSRTSLMKPTPLDVRCSNAVRKLVLPRQHVHQWCYFAHMHVRAWQIEQFDTAAGSRLGC